jgi:hypothetical protein
MSYGDDRDDYYRDLNRRDEYNREENRRYDNFMEDMKLDKERTDLNTEEALTAIQEGDIAGGALKLGMTDFAIDYLQSQANRTAEAELSFVQITALNQLGALSESNPGIKTILNDPSLSPYDRIYLAVMNALGYLDEEIMKHLDALRDTTDFDGEMAAYHDLGQKRTELQESMTQLYEEENERLRKVIQANSE